MYERHLQYGRDTAHPLYPTSSPVTSRDTRLLHHGGLEVDQK